MTASLFSDVKQGYNKTNFIVDGNRGYLAPFNNNTAIFALYSMTFIESVDAIFVIQGACFVQAGNLLMRLVLQNGLIASLDNILKTDGLVFCGATLDYAVYYSLFERKFYSFTGAVNMVPIVEANSIKEVVFAKFLQEIHAVCIGVQMVDNSKKAIIFKDGFASYLIPGSSIDISATDNGELVCYESDGSITKLQMEYDSNLLPIPVKLETSFSGSGDVQNNTVDCWYIKLFKDQVPYGKKYHYRLSRSQTVPSQGPEKSLRCLRACSTKTLRQLWFASSLDTRPQTESN